MVLSYIDMQYISYGLHMWYFNKAFLQMLFSPPCLHSLEFGWLQETDQGEGQRLKFVVCIR